MNVKRKNIFFYILTVLSGVVQEQTGGNSAIAPTAAAIASATKKDNRMNNSIDSNQKTLLDFKKSLLEEQKNGESRIEKINQKIEETKRILPIGFWKGSGFAVLLDIISALLSGGLTTAGIDKYGKGSCGSCCQVFIAINPVAINTQEFIDNALSETIAQLKSSVPVKENGEIFYPGEQSLKTRHENMQLGIPVDDGVWAKVKELAGM